MSSDVIIDLGRDFARLPFGRFPDDGPNNATRFRDEFVIPALEKGGTVTVVLDNAKGIGSSFLEETFGELAKRLGFSVDDFFRRIVIVSEDHPDLIESVREYVTDFVGE